MLPRGHWIEGNHHHLQHDSLTFDLNSFKCQARQGTFCGLKRGLQVCVRASGIILSLIKLYGHCGVLIPHIFYLNQTIKESFLLCLDAIKFTRVAKKPATSFMG